MLNIEYGKSYCEGLSSGPVFFLTQILKKQYSSRNKINHHICILWLRLCVFQIQAGVLIPVSVSLFQLIYCTENKHFAVLRVERHRNVVPHYCFNGVKQPD